MNAIIKYNLNLILNLIAKGDGKKKWRFILDLFKEVAPPTGNQGFYVDRINQNKRILQHQSENFKSGKLYLNFYIFD